MLSKGEEIMKIKLFTTESVEGYTIERYGGTVVGSMSYGKGFWTTICLGFANIFGTKVNHIVKKIDQCRKMAITELREKAESLDCNAVIGLRMEIIGLSIMVYGTAVELAKIGDSKGK